MNKLTDMNLLIKPTSSLCNLRCMYCFYLDTAKNRDNESYGMMSEETLETVIKNAFTKDLRRITIAFQGGEPTLAGLDFFVKAVEFINKYNINKIPVNKAIQTNGIVVDDSWAEFFKKNNFLVGVSLDGPQEFHDKFRVYSNGNGSYKQVMAAINILKKHKVDFNILCVVNSITAKKIHTIYNFYKKNGFEYLQFIPCIQGFGEENTKMPYTLTPKEFGTYMCTLFNLWYEDFIKTGQPHIRQFENYIEMILGYPPESCGMSGLCICQNVIEADGSCFPCDFYVIDKFKLGNVYKNSYEEMLNTCRELGFIQDHLITDDKCKTCKHIGLCRGGCRRYCEPIEGENRSLNLLCDGYYHFFENCTERMVNIARAITQGRKLG